MRAGGTAHIAVVAPASHRHVSTLLPGASLVGARPHFDFAAGSLRACLYKAARDKAFDYLKHKEVVAAWKRQAGAAEGESFRSPAEGLRQKALRRTIEAALAELPKRRRLIFG